MIPLFVRKAVFKYRTNKIETEITIDRVTIADLNRENGQLLNLINGYSESSSSGKWKITEKERSNLPSAINRQKRSVSILIKDLSAEETFLDYLQKNQSVRPLVREAERKLSGKGMSLLHISREKILELEVHYSTQLRAYKKSLDKLYAYVNRNKGYWDKTQMDQVLKHLTHQRDLLDDIEQAFHELGNYINQERREQSKNIAAAAATILAAGFSMGAGVVRKRNMIDSAQTRIFYTASNAKSKGNPDAFLTIKRSWLSKFGHEYYVETQGLMAQACWYMGNEDFAEAKKALDRANRAKGIDDRTKIAFATTYRPLYHRLLLLLLDVAKRKVRAKKPSPREGTMYAKVAGGVYRNQAQMERKLSSLYAAQTSLASLLLQQNYRISPQQITELGLEYHLERISANADPVINTFYKFLHDMFKVLYPRK